jgi:hypothetical protein
MGDESPLLLPPRRHHHHMTNKNKNKNKDNMNNSKEETEGRDTPLSLYSAIVGGEGQDFVATTLSTSAQVCDTLVHESVLDFISPFPRIFNRVVSLFALSFSLLRYDDDKCNKF